MMEQSDIDAGTIAAIMLRFREYRLPRAKRLLESVKNGNLLTDDDIGFLNRVHRDGLHVQPLVKRNPEYTRLIVRTMGLYTEIIQRGLENEESCMGRPARTP